MTTPTLSQLGEMTDEELNVRLLELVGVCVHPKDKRGWYDGGEESVDTEYCSICRASETLGGSLDPMHGIPDYPNDANAVAEVRKGLNETQQHAYSVILPMLTWGDREWDNWRDTWAIANADLRTHVITLIATLTP